LAGLGRIDAAAAAAASIAGVPAAGVVAVVDASMERAVRVVTVEQGIDPRDLRSSRSVVPDRCTCGVADALGMRTVIVPPRAGVFSAVGLVSSPRRRELVKTWATPACVEGLDDARDALARDVSAAVGGAELVETFVDCRYEGQSHELTVRRPADFAAEHERRNGYARPGAPVEVVALRARGSRAAPLTVDQLPAVALTDCRA
jgi:N-methylhydantoinase A/oxoprolinase/acetone carboxylase beta subunit